MRGLVIALALGSMLTVEQRDRRRGPIDPPSAAVSAEGRYVAFTTYSQLAPADRDARRDVYVLDRRDQSVTLESLPLQGQLSSDSSHPAISGDGRVLVYETGDRVILRDRRDGHTRILGTGRQPAVSSDGTVAVFSSQQPPGLVVWDLTASSFSSIADGFSPSISGTGRYIAFASAGAVWVHDRQRHTTDRLAAGGDPAMSADGQSVAYVSTVGALFNVFLFDRRTGTAQCVSRSRNGRAANGASVNPAVSADGRRIAFQSEASNLVDADEDFNLLWDVFLADRDTGVTVRLSGDPEAGWMEPSGSPAIDGRGEVVAFSSKHPTDASDKQNDFDLFVTSYGAASRQLLVGSLGISRCCSTHSTMSSRISADDRDSSGAPRYIAYPPPPLTR